MAFKWQRCLGTMHNITVQTKITTKKKHQIHLTKKRTRKRIPCHRIGQTTNWFAAGARMCKICKDVWRRRRLCCALLGGWGETDGEVRWGKRWPVSGEPATFSFWLVCSSNDASSMRLARNASMRAMPSAEFKARSKKWISKKGEHEEKCTRRRPVWSHWCAMCVA